MRVFKRGASFVVGSRRTSDISSFGRLVAGCLVYLGLNADRRGWALGLGVLFGGAAGNLVDRIFRAGDGVLGGHVVDFVDLQWWPVFNVADIALWIGIGLLVLSSSREAIFR